jgi:hypothetical protein
MFEPFENLNHIIAKNVCAFNPKKRKKIFNTNVNCKFQDLKVLKMFGQNHFQ